MFRTLVFISSVLAAATASDLEEPAARLLFFKSSKTDPVVEGKEFSVQYEVFNNGELPAHEVQISDRYDPSSFDIIGFESDEGTIAASVSEISAGDSWSFNVTVVPKLFGIYESTRARMRYVSGEVDPESEEDLDAATRNGYSSTIGRIKIISAEENTKNQTMEAVRYAFLGALFIVPTLFALYYFNRPESEKTPSKKDKSKKKR